MNLVANAAIFVLFGAALYVGVCGYVLYCAFRDLKKLENDK
jgi:hypothetical protein